MSTPMSAHLLSYREAAARADMFYLDFYRLCAKRQGPRSLEVDRGGIKPRVMFAPEDVDRWLASREAK